MGVLITTRAMVMPGPGLLPEPMSGFMTLLQQLSVWMCMLPDTTKDRENTAVQSTSLTTTLGRACPAHQLQHSGEQLTCLQRLGRAGHEGMRMESVLAPLSALWWSA